MAFAKIEMARRQLYSSFVRGKAIASSGAGMESNVGASTSKAGAGAGCKRKAADDSGSESEGERAASKARRKEMKAMRKEMRAKRRAAKAAKRGGAVTVASKDEEGEGAPVDVPVAEAGIGGKERKDKKHKGDKQGTKEGRRDLKKAKQHLSPEELVAAEEAAYAEAKRVAKVQRRAEKDLAKAVKKSLDG